jgi:hypothetical protein
MSQVWVPGLRSTMVLQVFQPLVYLGVLFGVLNLIRARRPRIARGVEVVGAAGLCTAALLVGLQFNWQLNRRTAVEERFEAGLKSIVPQPDHTKFIVRMAPGVWGNSDSLSEAYVQTFYGTTNVNMRILQPGPAVSKWENYGTVIFGKDDQGVLMGDAGATEPHWVPYSQVRIVSFDGNTVRLMDQVNDSDLAGFMVGFQRSAPIQQAATGGLASSEADTSGACLFGADFNSGLPGSGWSAPEHTPDGAVSFQWMTSTAATARFDMPCQRAASVRFRVLYAMSPDILRSVALQVDGVSVPLTSTSDYSGESTFTGTVPQQVIEQAHGSHELRFSVSQTVAPQGSNRALGVALDQLVVRPAGAT